MSSSWTGDHIWFEAWEEAKKIRYKLLDLGTDGGMTLLPVSTVKMSLWGVGDVEDLKMEKKVRTGLFLKHSHQACSAHHLY